MLLSTRECFRGEVNECKSGVEKSVLQRKVDRVQILSLWNIESKAQKRCEKRESFNKLLDKCENEFLYRFDIIHMPKLER